MKILDDCDEVEFIKYVDWIMPERFLLFYIIFSVQEVGSWICCKEDQGNSSFHRFAHLNI